MSTWSSCGKRSCTPDDVWTTVVITICKDYDIPDFTTKFELHAYVKRRTISRPPFLVQLILFLLLRNANLR